MAFKQYGTTVLGNIKTYIVPSTDTATDYPTATDCGAGSEMAIVDETTHEIIEYKFFDGTNWNTM